jgi:hypothetical protein
MSSRVAVRYRREPIMLLYSHCSTTLLFSSRFSDVAMLIRHGLEVSHVELLHQVIRVLGLMYECPLLHLLDLDT